MTGRAGRSRAGSLAGKGRRALWVASMVAAMGCGVGEGTGQVSGTLMVNAEVTRCKEQPPLNYRMNPDFFTAQPIDADPITAPGFPKNQIIIRLQRSGARIEDADALLFWVFDSAAVARCLRGDSPGGVPEWDPVACDRSAAVLGPNGEGRLLVGMTSEVVSSFFVLNASCPNQFVSSSALGLCTDGSCPDVALCPGRGSWIYFSRFGRVIPRGSRIPDGSGTDNGAFAIGDKDYISANIDPTGALPSFHLELCDAATVTAKLDNFLPIPVPRILGTLEGNFDFKFERGQAGQPFP